MVNDRPRGKSRGPVHGARMPQVGDYNQLVVFDLIRRAKNGVSRIEVAEATGLSAQTVTNAVSRMIDNGWVVQGDRVLAPTRGKPRTLLHANPSALYAVGIHIEQSSVSGVLMDLSGRIDERVQVRGSFGRDQIGDVIESITDQLVLTDPKPNVLGIGCSVPGLIDLNSGAFAEVQTLPGWDGLPLRDLLSERTGYRAYVQKDSVAALAAELWNRQGQTDATSLYVYAGFGLGFAFSQKGLLQTGSTGNLGEAGHIKVDFDSAECSCGRRRCVGKVVEYEEMLAKAIISGALPLSTPRETREDLASAMDRLVVRAYRGNSDAKHLVETACQALAQAAVIAADLLDADEIILGGSNAARLSPDLAVAVRRECELYSSTRSVHAITVRESSFGSWVGAAGGASLVFDAQLSPLPNWLGT